MDFKNWLVNSENYIAVSGIIGLNELNALCLQTQILLDENTTLATCDPKSILDCVMQARILGLSISKFVKHAYLIPRGGMCTLLIGYLGSKYMALNKGLFKSLDVMPYYEGNTLVPMI